MKNKQTMTDMLFTVIGFERNFVENSKDIPKCTVHFAKKRNVAKDVLNYQVIDGELIK